MRSHRRGSFRSSSSARRKLVWSGLDQNVVVASGAYTNLNLLGQLAVAGSSLLGITIMRTHLKIGVQNWAAVADEIGVGLLVVRNTDIGAAVVGAPNTNNLELDWMFLTRLYAPSEGATVTVAQTYDFDNRSKRKMQELNQAYSLSILNSAAASKTMNVFARTLVALP
jgi:hypothetical protein